MNQETERLLLEVGYACPRLAVRAQKLAELILKERDREIARHDSMVIYNDQLLTENNTLRDALSTLLDTLCIQECGGEIDRKLAIKDARAALELENSTLRNAEQAKLNAWIAEGDELFTLMEKKSVWFSVGVWWADRPWRNKDEPPAR